MALALKSPNVVANRAAIGRRNTGAGNSGSGGGGGGSSACKFVFDRFPRRNKRDFLPFVVPDDT